MKTTTWIASLATLALAGCSSSGPTGTPFSATAGGLAATALVGEEGITVSGEPDASTAQIEFDGEDGVTLAFAGGPLDERNIRFTVDEDEDGIILAGANPDDLLEGEDAGNLTALFASDKASFAGFVSIETGDFDDPDEGDQAKIYALYGPNPTATHSAAPENAQLSYAGRFVGAGADTDENAGGLMGTVAIDADFATGAVTGTIADLAFDDVDASFSGGDVGFAATMSTDKASYSGTEITMSGNAATGVVEGGFYGIQAAETAGAIFADDTAGNALIGGFQADMVP
jgi:hypothetical protein